MSRRSMYTTLFPRYYPRYQSTFSNEAVTQELQKVNSQIKEMRISHRREVDEWQKKCIKLKKMVIDLSEEKIFQEKRKNTAAIRCGDERVSCCDSSEIVSSPS